MFMNWCLGFQACCGCPTPFPHQAALVRRRLARGPHRDCPWLLLCPRGEHWRGRPFIAQEKREPGENGNSLTTLLVLMLCCWLFLSPPVSRPPAPPHPRRRRAPPPCQESIW